MQKLLTTDETASILGLKKQTLAKWRCHGSHPELKYIKLGSRCRYTKESVMSFITGNVK
jgi:hypothetical protein